MIFPLPPDNERAKPMPYFDRFDVCEAHYVLEMDYNVSGWLQERPSNLRRMEATHVQLHRMGFKPRDLSYAKLTENGQEIYDDLVAKYDLPTSNNESA